MPNWTKISGIPIEKASMGRIKAVHVKPVTDEDFEVIKQR